LDTMEKLDKFNAGQTKIINKSVAMSEELVCNFYKMSVHQWLRHQYDVKTLVDLNQDEIVHGPFAQIVRYQGQRKNTSLGSSTYDFYKICLQDHAIIESLNRSSDLNMLSFVLYIITHELVHIVRFSKFLVNFNASHAEKKAEEVRVHKEAQRILEGQQVPGLKATLDFYAGFGAPIDETITLPIT